MEIEALPIRSGERARTRAGEPSVDSSDGRCFEHLYRMHVVETGADRAIPPKSLLYEASKRTIDIFVSGFLLLVLAPVFALICVAIALDDRGAVLFRQKRVGKHGMLFDFWKVRSMVTNAGELQTELAARNEADGPIFKMRRDPRVTRVGRYLRKLSLDELPQLLSVFLGTMTLIGPRPHLPKEALYYGTREWMRLSMKPGLMCIREVSGRSKMSFDDWIESDLRYLQERSFLLDLRILLLAVRAVLGGRGAY